MVVSNNVYLNLKSLKQSVAVSWENSRNCDLRVYCIPTTTFTPVLLNCSPPFLLTVCLSKLYLKWLKKKKIPTTKKITQYTRGSSQQSQFSLRRERAG